MKKPISWVRLDFYGGAHDTRAAVTHFCPQRFADQIDNDICRRLLQDHRSAQVARCETSPVVGAVSFDLPGMARIGRPTVSIDLRGLALEIPCCDVRSFVLQTKNIRLRGAPGYYKLHGFHRALVLGPQERIALRAALKACEADARQRDEAFEATFKRPLL